jgi:hypothetical protein
MKQRCEGWRRYGGAFTLGPVKWEQCKNDAIVVLKVEQEKVVENMPSCLECWNEAKASGILIHSAEPLSKGFCADSSDGHTANSHCS